MFEYLHRKARPSPVLRHAHSPWPFRKPSLELLHQGIDNPHPHQDLEVVHHLAAEHPSGTKVGTLGDKTVGFRLSGECDW
jgi:hypothetical protein